MKKIFLILILTLFCLAVFAQHSRVDTLATINSFSALGDFYTINYQGDYEDILDYLDNLYVGREAEISDLGCSLYSSLGDDENIYLGRNFDNPQQDVLIGKYSAENSYESIAACRLADMGLILGTDFSNLSQQQKMQLLKAPYFAADGMNEMGLSAGLAYVDTQPVVMDPNKETIFITRWVREILDHAATAQEAVDISNSYNIVDNMSGQDQLCHHLLITDSSGSSVILEYHDGAFEAIQPEEDWQVLTNTSIWDHTQQQLFNLCYRYELLYDALEEQEGVISDWRNGMDILDLPTWGNITNGTQWSILYDLNEKELYISIQRDFQNIARVEVESFEFLNFGVYSLENLTILDSDSDGTIEPGESVELYISVVTDFLSTGVQAELVCSSNDIEITSGSYGFGNMQPAEVSLNFDQPLSFTVAEDFSETSVEFNLNLQTDYGYEYNLNLPLDIATTSSDEEQIPALETFLTNYPNPFNPTTEISFTVKNTKDTKIEIYNLKGQQIRSYLINSSSHKPINSVIWNGTNSQNNPVSSGIYYAVLKQNLTVLASHKMLLMK